MDGPWIALSQFFLIPTFVVATGPALGNARPPGAGLLGEPPSGRTDSAR